MKQKLDIQLENMTVPTVQRSRSQEQLRRVLVFRANQTNKQNTRGVLYFMSKRNFIIGSGIAAVMALTALSLSTLGPAQAVNAQQLAQNSAQALANMSPEEAEYKKFYPYFVDWVEMAQKAPDLRVLTYEEVARSYPSETGSQPSTVNEPMRVIDDKSDGEMTNIRELRYLEFSHTYDDNSTFKIVVGINERNIPEAALTHFVSGPIEPRIGG